MGAPARTIGPSLGSSLRSYLGWQWIEAARGREHGGKQHADEQADQHSLSQPGSVPPALGCRGSPRQRAAPKKQQRNGTAISDSGLRSLPRQSASKAMSVCTSHVLHCRAGLSAAAGPGRAQMKWPMSKRWNQLTQVGRMLSP